MARGPIKHRGVSRKLGEWLFANKNIDVNLREFRKDNGLPDDYDLSSALWHLRKAWNMDIVTVVPGLAYRYVGDANKERQDVMEQVRGERERIEAAQAKVMDKPVQKTLLPRIWEELITLPDSDDVLLWRNDETVWRATQLK